MKIFLSHSSEDKQFARQLRSRFETSGLEVWLDEAALIPGASWVQQISKAIDRADVFVALVGANWSSPWVQKETAAALSQAENNPSLRIIPIFLPGSKRDEVPQSLRSRVGLDLGNVAETLGLFISPCQLGFF